MPLTAAERAKNYRDRVKKKTAKYLEIKRKDCERKAKKRASLNMKEKEIFLESHRKAQRVYRRKVKEQDNKKKDANRFDSQSSLTSLGCLWYLDRYTLNTHSPKR